MVSISRGSTQWTGMMIASSGLILTTSRNLDSAPVADFLTAEGAVGQAWVIGRDDTIDVALLEVIDPDREYATIEVASVSPPQLDEGLAALFFLATTGTTPNIRNARVIGAVQDLSTGTRYVQIQAIPETGAEGGALIDTEGRLRGLRMTEAQMLKLGLGRAGEVWAMASDVLGGVIVPRLQAGVLEILPPDASATVGEDPGGPPPPVPAIYHGSVTIGGEVPSQSSRLYARVIKSSLPDLWFSQPLDTTGEYIVPVGVTVTGYDNATIEFWTDAKRATQVAVYTPSLAVTLDLTFP